MMQKDVSALNEQELTIHQIIDDVIADFFQSDVEVGSQQQFDKSIGILLTNIFDKFKEKYRKIKDHDKYKNIFLNAVRFKQDELLHIPEFSNVILEVKELDGASEKPQTYFDSVRMYCAQKNKDEKEVILFLIKIHALISVYHEIGGYYLNSASDNSYIIDKTRETVLIVESFQGTLIAIATGSKDEEMDYKKSREELLKINELSSLIPDFVKTNRTAAQFWQFIKPKFPSYAQRKEYIWAELAKIFHYLERHNRGVADEGITKKIDKFNQSYIKNEWTKALYRKADDPEGAITSSRTLIETTCKFILDEFNVGYKDDIELPKLYKLTAENLNLAPDQHTEQIFKQILGGCQAVVDGLGALRNKLSDSHGKKVTQPKPSQRHAELAVNLSGALTTFLLETYDFKTKST